MEPIFGVIVGIVLGGGALYAVLRDRTHQRDAAVRERDELRASLAQAKAEISGYQSTETAREKAFEERRAELDTHFKGLASDVLKSSTEEFRKQAAEQFRQHQESAGKDLKARETAVENLVKPVRESLEKLREHVDASDKARVADTTEVRQSVNELIAATSGLKDVLHNPQLRGQWGEQHLRKVIEAAGMTSRVDYVEQDTVGNAADGGRGRPDVVVNLPDGKRVVIDAKTPHDRYNEALRSNNEQEQEDLLKAHATALNAHAKTLGDRDYPQRVDGSLDFTVMYVPTDPMLDAAIKVKPNIWQDAWRDHRVLIATPGLLIAFLHTIALAWQQQDIQRNANMIADTARELYDRLVPYARHFNTVGNNLGKALKAYNEGVGSFQRSVLPQARRIEDLAAISESKQIAEPAPVEATVRQIEAPELQPAVHGDRDDQ